MTPPLSTSPLPSADQVGAATLERLAEAPRFNRWMYDRLAPWIGDAVIEVGSGIGNLSQFLVDRDRVVLTDTEPAYRAHLEQRFGDRAQVQIRSLTLPDAPPDLQAEPFDTVVGLNVLEHIEGDVDALAAMRAMLRPGGAVVLLVPAVPALYGELDRALGHHRRYTPALLRGCFASAGLTMRHMEYFNLAGMPGWWWVGRVLQRSVIPVGGLRWYDALVPLFKFERFLPWRWGQSLIAIGVRTV
ncbi:MAG: class I SAM-dependent methyltransferase [Gemmatimonadota bacterium]|nr:class I SAM-dependent methyltransferase [Gemmatimonadota bacterium]MDH5195826.1 class I SAM-dependent methyltransferase [Gemmatimonadota bacterium]